MSPRRGDNWTPWTPEEDAVLLSTSRTADILEKLQQAGHDRTRAAVLSRRKILLKGKPVRHVKPQELAAERVLLEQELSDLDARRGAVVRRLKDVRYAQARDVLQDIELPEEVLQQIRRQLDGDGTG